MRIIHTININTISLKNQRTALIPAYGRNKRTVIFLKTSFSMHYRKTQHPPISDLASRGRTTLNEDNSQVCSVLGVPVNAGFTGFNVIRLVH